MKAPKRRVEQILLQIEPIKGYLEPHRLEIKLWYISSGMFYSVSMFRPKFESRTRHTALYWSCSCMPKMHAVLTGLPVSGVQKQANFETLSV